MKSLSKQKVNNWNIQKLKLKTQCFSWEVRWKKLCVLKEVGDKIVIGVGLK